jgi:hypothetical protein
VRGQGTKRDRLLLAHPLLFTSHHTSLYTLFPLYHPLSIDCARSIQTLIHQLSTRVFLAHSSRYPTPNTHRKYRQQETKSSRDYSIPPRLKTSIRDQIKYKMGRKKIEIRPLIVSGVLGISSSCLEQPGRFEFSYLILTLG